MTDNYMDDYAKGYRQESADAPFGSVASWNAYFNANNAQAEADNIRSGQRARAEPASALSASPFPLFTPTTYCPSAGGSSSASKELRVAGPPSRFAKAFGAFILWLAGGFLIMVFVVAALFYGARWADKEWQTQVPDGGIARYALAKVVPNAQLQPSAYLRPAGLAKLPTATNLAEQLGRPRTSGVQPRQLLASAYICQMDVTCRNEAARNFATEAIVRRAATDYLQNRIGAGDVTAVDGACFLSMSTNTMTVSVSEARLACFQALSTAQRTKKTDVLQRARANAQLFKENPWFIAAYAMDRAVPLF